MSEIVIVFLSSCIKESECVGVVPDTQGDHIVIEHGWGVFLEEEDMNREKEED